MMPATQMPNVDVSMAARNYVSAGWSLVPIARGSKGPRHTGWNERPQCIDDESRAGKVRGGIGLAHAYSGTACLDFDKLEESSLWFFEEHGIDVHALMHAPDAVQIRSGRPNRGKLLYRLPAGVDALITVKVPEVGLEFRCGTRDGKTVQDVLPPTIHPDTLVAYQWAGAGDWHALPELPAEILAVWRALEANVDPVRDGAGVPDGDPDADPVAQHLDAGKWVRAKLRDGTRHIRCPFEHEHESFKQTGKPGTVGDCSYFPAATGGYARGHFHCLHTTCEGRADEDFLEAIAYNPHAVYAKEQAPIVDEVEAPFPSFPRDKKGQIDTTIDHVVRALRHTGMAAMALGYDQFRDEIMFSTEPGAWQSFKDTHYTDLRMRLERLGFKSVGREIMRDAVAKVAEDNRFDSAQLWLASLPAWDGVPRMAGFMATVFGAEDTDYNRAVGVYLWTAMAGRILQPGVKADMVPILVGEQGIKKSTAVAAMAPAIEFFCEINFVDKEVDMARRMRGRLVAEIGELRGLNSRELDHIKAFITRTHEDWTPKFKEFNTVFARRLVFIGTTNQSEFLADETGNRRFLPVLVSRADVFYIEQHREQLWAEAAAQFAVSGVAWSDAERLARDQHQHHMITDPWENTVRDWLEQVGPDGLKNASRKYLRVNDVLKFALHFDDKHIGRREELRVGKVLRAVGYEKTDIRENGKIYKAWVAACPF